MIKKITQSTSLRYIALVGVLAIAGLVATYVAAWTAPTAPAPGGNVAAPLNTGAIAQTKNNSINVTQSFIAQDGVAAVNGSRMVGTPAGTTDGYSIARRFCLANTWGAALLGVIGGTDSNSQNLSCIDSWSDLCVGQNNQIVLCSGVTTPPPVGTNSPQVFATAGNHTFTAPTAGTYTFEIWGAGGGGSGAGRGVAGNYEARSNGQTVASANLSIGGTGGAGGQAGERKIQTVTLAAGQTVNITVGAGGNGGAGGTTSDTTGSNCSGQVFTGQGQSIACGQVNQTGSGTNGAAGGTTSISGGINLSALGGQPGSASSLTLDRISPSANLNCNVQIYSTPLGNGLGLRYGCGNGYPFSFATYLSGVAQTVFAGATTAGSGTRGNLNGVCGTGGAGGKPAAKTTVGGFTQVTPLGVSLCGQSGTGGAYGSGGAGGAGGAPNANGGAGGKGGDGAVIVSW